MGRGWRGWGFIEMDMFAEKSEKGPGGRLETRVSLTPILLLWENYNFSVTYMPDALF